MFINIIIFNIKQYVFIRSHQPKCVCALQNTLLLQNAVFVVRLKIAGNVKRN